MEYLGGGSCLDLIKPGPFHESQVAIVCRELLHALDYLHQTGKIHRDIKAANILLAVSGKVKIADFGVAAQLTNIRSQRMTFVGTPFWMAPEVIEESGYDFRADIWSLGITAMELALGEPPNANIHPMKVLFHIPKAPPPRLEGQFSKEFKDFVALCLQKEPDKRPTARELLRHRFIRNAGKVDQLRDVIRRYERHVAKGEKTTHPKYYEETLQDLSPKLEQDDWIFDTIKPATIAPPRRRKMSRIPSDASDVTNPYATVETRESPSAMLERMDISDGPLGTGSPAHGYPTMMRKSSQTGTSRRSSVVTAQRAPSGQTPTARRVSRTDGTPQKKPLGLDMSFGNSPSSARPFRRVSSGGHEKKWAPERDVSNSSIAEPRVGHGLDREKSASNASTLVGSDENTPPLSMAEDGYFKKELPIPVKPIQLTKEALLGRRAYSKVVDATFQEQHAQTGDLEKREALARLHNAWSVLDRIDPEGEFLLLRSLIENAREDPKLSAALGLSNALPPTTPISSPTKHASPVKNTPVLPPAPVRAPMAPPSAPATPRHRQTQSVSDIDASAITRTPSSAAKQRLVLAQNNPHLKSHRRRQSALLESEIAQKLSAVDEKRMPGYVPPGMEQSGGLADALYSRWLEGLKSRWGGS
ncbi:hypothetical protein, variant [Verruconis gallopava]|nr:hypothetical protein, variant [Verruconis gallopava]KIW07129.1 hypothetical protein, variant [Verruconis gallopava]